jgi:hypothetical protein
MRFLRVLAAATGFAALLSQPSAAQDGRQFKDAWFWGAKAGGLLYSSATTNGSVAPLVGAEWLITRTNGGLYVSFDQAFLTTGGQFIDHDADTAFTRPVTLKNLRRLTIAGMVFPLQQRDLHPYAGFGFTLNQIAGTALQNNFTSTQRYEIALDSVRAKKATFSPVFIGGVQARYRPFSAFVQASATPTQQGFFLYGNGGRAFNMSLETGVRYNVGSAIDRAR